ncbi:MAG: hypothetical protein ABGX16_22795 [Pirellulales bacterium]
MLFGDRLGDKLDSYVDRFDSQSTFIVHVDIEFFLKRGNQFHALNRLSTQVLDKPGGIPDLTGSDL